MGRFVAVVWGAAAPDGATDLYAAVSRDDGQTFGSPRLVNDAASTPSLDDGGQSFSRATPARAM
jgi:hypothetical protein